MSQFERIYDALKPQRDALLNHSVYARLNGIEEMQTFMEHHVFAVWDFMCLLKSLQNRLTCTQTLWHPVENADSCRFINEIVLCEESDENRGGGFASHFQLYHLSMKSAGACTQKIDRFLELLRNDQSPSEALGALDNPESVNQFVADTLQIIEKGKLCEVAAFFAFGREDLLPDLFEKVVAEVNAASDGALDDFQYYLNRHIEVDGDDHGPMAKKMVESICGNDEAQWDLVSQAASQALNARLRLWDGMASAMSSTSNVSSSTL